MIVGGAILVATAFLILSFRTPTPNATAEIQSVPSHIESQITGETAHLRRAAISAATSVTATGLQSRSFK